MGGQLITAARIGGDLLLGTVGGGVVCQFARFPGEAFTTYLCCLSLIFIAVAALLRARYGHWLL